MSIVRELFDDAVALRKRAEPNRIALALTDRWEAGAGRRGHRKVHPFVGGDRAAFPRRQKDHLEWGSLAIFARLTSARLGGGLLALSLCAGDAPRGGRKYRCNLQRFLGGVPAGKIRLTLGDGGSAYRNEIAIETVGLPHLLTLFRATASPKGSGPQAGRRSRQTTARTVIWENAATVGSACSSSAGAVRQSPSAARTIAAASPRSPKISAKPWRPCTTPWWA